MKERLILGAIVFLLATWFKTIETRPYTTAIVALGIGWLLGRMHRPL